jgi:predicted RNA-binding protein YlxR (DUF448 family)
MPIRTCLISNKKVEKSTFLRFTIQNGFLKFDGQKPRNGRGGYVLPTIENLEKIKSPKIKGKILHFLKIKNLKIEENEINEQIEKLKK